MDIAFCLDNNYLMPCGVALCSVCENNKSEDITFHIVSTNLNAASQQSLENISTRYGKQIHFYKIDESLINRFPAKEDGQPEQITLAAYIRIFLCDLLPQEVKKVLYLDCDLVVTDNLAEMWNIDLVEYAGAAVPDYCCDDIRHYNRMKIDPKYQYCNSGVFLLNLEYWREHNVLDQMITFFKEHRERVFYHDQDLLNGVLYDKIVRLDAKFNVQIAYWAKPNWCFTSFQRWDELANARKHPVIVHYISTMKPWFKECFYTPQEYFLHYKSLTEWKDQPLGYLYPAKIRFTRFVRHLFEDLHLMKRRVEVYDMYFPDFIKREHLR